jgi:hypothetical protein
MFHINVIKMDLTATSLNATAAPLNAIVLSDLMFSRKETGIKLKSKASNVRQRGNIPACPLASPFSLIPVALSLRGQKLSSNIETLVKCR